MSIKIIKQYRVETTRVFGFCFAELLILDPSMANEVLITVLKRDTKTLQTFTDGFGRDSSSWLLYKDLRPLYEHVILDENATISSELVRHIAFAYLVGWEELRGESSLLAHIRKESKLIDRADFIEILLNF